MNQTVEELYSVQRQWNKNTRKELKQLSLEMYERNGFEQFQLITSELRDTLLSKSKLCVILYVCIELSKMYINIGETFAVKYFVDEINNNLKQMIQKKVNEDNGYESM